MAATETLAPTTTAAPVAVRLSLEVTMNATTTLVSITAAELQVGDVVVQGHGYGEAPATVLRVGRWTKGTVRVTLSDGPGRERALLVSATEDFRIEQAA